jgi:hypothetical protein
VAVNVLDSLLVSVQDQDHGATGPKPKHIMEENKTKYNEVMNVFGVPEEQYL